MPTAYPNPYTRLFNFQRDANDGLESPAPGKVDSELNGIQATLEQTRQRIVAVTSVDGRLRNVPAALAAALVGTWAGTSTGVVTFTTTIPWQAAFSVNSVLIMAANVPYRPAQITSVQDDGGFLAVTLAVAPTASTALTVWAFEPGAGILTLLGSTANAEGAALIGVEDAGDLLAADDVEEALAEIATNLAALTAAIGATAELFKRDGAVAATGDFDMGGNKITGAADAVDPGDLVTLRQLAEYVAIWNDLSQFFYKRDGSGALTGALDYGNQKGTNLADADLTVPTDAVNVRTMQQAIAYSGGVPVGTIVDYVGVTPPDNWLLCDGASFAKATYPVLAEVLGLAFQVDALNSRTPDCRGRVTVGTGTESKTPGVADPKSVAEGDPYNSTARTLGDIGGEEKHILTVAELATHNHYDPQGGTRYSQTAGSGDGGQGDSGGFAEHTFEPAGSDAAHNTMPPFFVATKIIKAA
jgi:microcystin-dependent protein